MQGRRNNGKKSKRTRTRRPRTRVLDVSVPAPRDGFASDAFTMWLTYTSDTTSFNSVGSDHASRSERLNAPFDMNPALGGGTPTGFAQWAAMYRHYLAKQAQCTYTIVNNENFPVFVCAAPTDTNFTASVVSKPLALAVGELPLALSAKVDNRRQTAIPLAAKGGQDRATLSGFIDFSELVGSRARLNSDDTYSSLVNTVPLSQLFLLQTISSDNVFVSGVSFILTIKLKVTFYGRQSPLA